jgi:hypothetical protein
METKTLERFVDGDVLTLTNVPVKWAATQRPDTKFESVWKINIILTDEQATKLKSVGFRVKTDKDGDQILTARRKTQTKSGDPIAPPTVVGRDGTTRFTEELGNGSVVNVRVWCKYKQVSGETYLPAYLNEIQVIEHIPYGGGGFGDVDSDEAAKSDLDF